MAPDLNFTAYLTTEQAAARLGLNPSTMRNWRCRGKGPMYAKFERLVRYPVAVLDKWADEQVGGVNRLTVLRNEVTPGAAGPLTLTVIKGG